MLAGVTLAVAVIGTPVACWSIFGGADSADPTGAGASTAAVASRTSPPVERFTRVEGWIPYWGDPAGTARRAARAGFTDLLFFAATLRPNSTVKMEQTARLSRGVKAAHAEGAATWLTVANHGKSLAKVLTPGNRDRLVEQLLAAHRLSSCHHLDLDLEQLTKSQTAELPPLAAALAARLPAGTRLGLTLQPVDRRLRPWAIPHVVALLEQPGVFTVRFMCYDYHWRTSLPGALYPKAAFERLLDTYPAHAEKLTVALPLYGYDWPRPEDTTVPRAKAITIAELAARAAQSGSRLVWMEQEGELALLSEGAGVRRIAAVPSLRTIAERSAIARAHGVPAVAFWHLGCGRLSEVILAARPGGGAGDPPSQVMARWDELLRPWKERVCKIVTARAGDSFATLAERHGVTRAVLYRFNEGLTDETMAGRRVYLPIRR